MKKIVVFGILALAGAMSVRAGEPLRAGLIGLDTSHVIAFTKIINNPAATGALARLTVVAGFPGGSPDLPASADRVAGYTGQLRAQGVDIVDSIPELLSRVDVVLLESVDGRPHLEQVAPVFKARKPVFIDKPLAGSLADGLAIKKLGERYETPWFSSSALRFSPGILAYRLEHPEVGRVTGCDAWGPCAYEEHHPDLFWYGIHGCEILFTILGRGVETVSRARSDSTDLVTGIWKDGRIGTFRGIRPPGKRDYGAMVFGARANRLAGSFAGYEPLLREIAVFFETRKPPVDADETLELLAFMEAADESKRRGGRPVAVAEVMEKAEADARLRLAEFE